MLIVHDIDDIDDINDIVEYNMTALGTINVPCVASKQSDKKFG